MDTLTDIAVLRRELAEMRAHHDIRARIHAYARSLDRLDRELLVAQFWPEAEVDYGSFYRGPVSGFFEVALNFQGSMRDTFHLVGNILVELDGERAAAESYVHASHVILKGSQRVQLTVGARYLDRFERRGSDWRLSYRTEVLDFGRWLPITENWYEESSELPKGLRDGNDLSYRFLRAARPRGKP